MTPKHKLFAQLKVVTYPFKVGVWKRVGQGIICLDGLAKLQINCQRSCGALPSNLACKRFNHSNMEKLVGNEAYLHMPFPSFPVSGA